MNLAGGSYAYVNADTKYILVSGASGNLETALYTGSINYDLAAISPTGASKVSGIYMLLTQDGNGNAVAKAVVINTTDIAVEGEPIYVSANQTQAKAATADGYVFEVYNAKTGELMEILLESAAALPVGFFTYTYDEDSNIYEIGSAYANVVTNTTYVSAYNGLLATDILFNIDASKAVVIDARSEAQIYADDVGTITSLDDINYLKNEEFREVILDIIVDPSYENVLAIYVVSVAYLPW